MYGTHGCVLVVQQYFDSLFRIHFNYDGIDALAFDVPLMMALDMQTTLRHIPHWQLRTKPGAPWSQQSQTVSNRGTIGSA